MSHNTFGHLFRITTWGESHGPALGCVIDGCPPRLALDVADGALGVHLKKLQTKRYVSLKLSYVGRRPKTTYRVTATGRRALMDYLDAMQELIDTVQAIPEKRWS